VLAAGAGLAAGAVLAAGAGLAAGAVLAALAASGFAGGGGGADGTVAGLAPLPRIEVSAVGGSVPRGNFSILVLASTRL
jgi:hypothetical protein